MTSAPGARPAFAFDLDRTFWEVLSLDHLKLLKNAVEWVTNEDPVLTVEGPGVLDVSVWRQKSSMTVHLVNLTNPMLMKGPIREIYPIGPLRVTFRGPAGTPKLLVAGTQPRSTRTGDRITVEVPSIRMHEVIAVDI